ncbi:MAG: hypothetical protein HeimC3_35240 [Candidatus Heimdallarchaeota archaeon LC_3]|nr:MAG: hypothetical protein HeimC3_35240 [Candidatus Heimdallarchaeota archaeon LC_3]
MSSESNDTNHKGTLICHNCTNKIPSESKYCPFCGQTVIKHAYCPKCNTIIASNFTICNNCGYELVEKIPCPTCQELLPRNAVYCAFCGNRTKSLGSYPAIANFSPQLEGYYSINQSQMNYYPTLPSKPRKPGVLKLPIFFFIFCIFGTELAFSFFITIIYGIVTLNPEVTTEITLILTIIVRLSQIILIYIIISNYKSFEKFRPFQIKSSKKDESEVNFEKKTDNFKRDSQFSLSIIINFIIVLTLLIYISETIFVYIIDFLKDTFSITNPTISPYTDYFASDSTIFLFTILAIIIAPIVEEVLFRGYLQHAFDKSEIPDWSQYFLQAFLFAFAHFLPDLVENSSWDFILIHMLSTGLFAITATWLRKKFGSVTYPILLHALSNSISTGLVVFSQYLPNNTDFVILDIVLVLISILIAIFLYIFLKRGNHWKISVPYSLKTFKQNKGDIVNRIILLTLISSVIFNILQVYVVILEFNQAFIYIVVVSLVSSFLYFIWPKYIVDSTISKLKSINYQKNSESN